MGYVGYHKRAWKRTTQHLIIYKSQFTSCSSMGTCWKSMLNVRNEESIANTSCCSNQKCFKQLNVCFVISRRENSLTAVQQICCQEYLSMMGSKKKFYFDNVEICIHFLFKTVHLLTTRRKVYALEERQKFLRTLLILQRLLWQLNPWVRLQIIQKMFCCLIVQSLAEHLINRIPILNELHLL